MVFGIENLFKFFDVFGIAVFTFILVHSILELKAGNTGWRNWVLLGIGIAGLLVDTGLVAFGKLAMFGGL